MSSIETFVLVEIDDVVGGTWRFGSQEETGTKPVIKRIVRTYESRSRADEDLALLQEAMPAARFDVQTIEHIDR